MSPQVIWLSSSSSVMFSGIGFSHLLTKYTPLFLVKWKRPMYFQATFMMIYQWTRECVQIYLTSRVACKNIHLSGVGQSVWICSCPPMFWEIIRICGLSGKKKEYVSVFFNVLSVYYETWIIWEDKWEHLTLEMFDLSQGREKIGPEQKCLTLVKEEKKFVWKKVLTLVEETLKMTALFVGDHLQCQSIKVFKCISSWDEWIII